MFSDALTDAQAVLLRGRGDDGSSVAIVAFRGSTSASDWIGNALVPTVRVPGHGRRVRAHAGFVRQYTALDLAINSAIDNMDDITGVLFCGHSLGGSLACIAASMWTANMPCQLVTFGAPRPGNAAFAAAVRLKTLGAITRVVHDLDIVPSTPMRFMRYCHVTAPWMMVDHGGHVTSEKEERTVYDELVLRAWGVIAADFGVSDHFMSRYLRAVPAQQAPATSADDEPATEPGTEPATEPPAEPADDSPSSEPAAEASSEPASEPAAEPASEPAAEPAAEPASEPAAEPASEPAAEPAAEPASEQGAEPDAKTENASASEEQADDPETEPAAEPATRATMRRSLAAKRLKK